MTNDIAKITVYAFTRMVDRPNNQVIAMWPEDFKRLANSDDNRSSKLTIDITAISPDDYKKFFTKIRKEPISEE